jgi:hypothetical protein
MGFKREKIVFQGVEGMPKYWKTYFSMSEIGQEYVILWDDEYVNGENLIMSDTEYEWKTNEILFDAIKEGDEILSLGYGIGLIVPEVEKRGGKLTVIEKYQEIINLEENLNEEVEVFIGDANEIKYEELFKGRKFDIIFSDLTEILKKKIELDKLLKENGEFIYWKHL